MYIWICIIYTGIYIYIYIYIVIYTHIFYIHTYMWIYICIYIYVMYAGPGCLCNMCVYTFRHMSKHSCICGMCVCRAEGYVERPWRRWRRALVHHLLGRIGRWWPYFSAAMQAPVSPPVYCFVADLARHGRLHGMLPHLQPPSVLACVWGSHNLRRPQPRHSQLKPTRAAGSDPAPPPTGDRFATGSRFKAPGHCETRA